ncbi:penicillin-binding protein 1A [Gracilibacillus sp. YIM 98692]|uniref:penicillin-binding protein 1A n=1 Tax=Gracilibacillus sp. YIM 98692 TaxID=2663532 RepID=UPI0013D615A9|nr:penicillin-binding protein 1A [Gracilibacillus sp. YIM 98692]
MANNGQTRMERRQHRKNNIKQKNSVWKKILKLLILAVLLIGIGVGALFSYYIASAPDLDATLLSDPASTEILDINEEVFATLGAEKRTKIDNNDIPEVLRNAIIATEDARFYDHIGIDFRRIGAAVIANFRDGFGSQGASTITQQVVKGSFLSNDKNLKRKVQEQWLALKLDRNYSKEEILEMYVNKIYYGAGAYGVATAAEVYFGKEDLDNLTLAEAAILAGLPQRPTAYDPFVDPELTDERKNTVLDLMVHHNKISQDQAEEAKNISVSSLIVKKKTDFVRYEGFIQQVRKEVMEKTGADIYKDSLKVYTTLDPDAQERVEFLLSNREDNPIDYSSDEEMQVGVTVLDTQTGAIRAIGGGRNRENDGWNYAIDGNGRQPGSTMKPIVAYGPAIEHLQWSTYHQLNDDKPYPIGGTSKVIENWNQSYQGWMTARYALKKSLNVPAVKTLEEVGYSKAKKFAEGLGISFADDQITIGDAIGGTATGVTPLQMAGAYAAFGNEGMYHEPYSVLRIEYPDNRTEELQSEPVVAMSDYTAYMITDMLKSVVSSSGTGARANVNGLPLVGKTGTTNVEGKDGSPDSWFTGYTTNYTVSVWTGYDQDQKIINNTKTALDIFRETIQDISTDEETNDFVQPDSVVEVSVEKGSNPAKRPSEYTPNSEIITELFVKGTEPDQVSEKFDQLEPVQNLEAEYNEDNEEIVVEWEHEEEDIQFDVSAGTNGSLNHLTTTDKRIVEISNVEKGETYTIEVIAINENQESEPVSTTIEIQEEEERELPAVEQLHQTFDPVNRSALVSWSYSENGPIEFNVEIEEAGSTVDQLTTNKTSVNLTQLQPNTTYTIHVTPTLKNEDIQGPSSTIQLSTEGLENSEGDNTDEGDQEEQQNDPQQDGEQQNDDDDETEDTEENNPVEQQIEDTVE